MAIQVLAREMLAKQRDFAHLAPGVKLADHLRYDKRQNVFELTSTGDFATAWTNRQRFEVDAGQDQEPLLYTPLYTQIVDADLPQIVSVYRIGPGEVAFEEVQEGSEAPFARLGESEFQVNIRQYAFGVEYTERMILYNLVRDMALIERQAGIAYNALLNNVHLSPFINATYGAANQTAAVTTGVSSLVEAYARTFENAVTNSQDDTSNRRPGPYAILCSTANRFIIERMLLGVAQEGFSLQSPSLGNSITTVIAYNGWTGRRGKKTVGYSGVPANKAYLIDLGYRDRNLRSYFKRTLQMSMGNPDVSRFIEAQMVWDVHFGVHTDVTASTEEVTLPTTFSAS